jgi:hypothetical protein
VSEETNQPGSAATPDTPAGESPGPREDAERRNFFKAAALGAGVAALAGAMHGKYGLAPVISEAQAQPLGAGTPWWPSR